MTSPAVVFCLLAVMLVLSATPALAQTCPPGNPRVAPDSRYVDNGNETVTDQETGLMWKRCSEGQSGQSCTGVASFELSWQFAMWTADSSSFAGHNDWRLPSVKELQSLVETGCRSPAINTTRFPNTRISDYWSSTTVASSASLAWRVNFIDGTVDVSSKSSINLGVRLVRGGQ